VLNFFKLSSDEKVQGELSRWQMNFSDRPTELKGRILPFEVIGFGEVKN
jgi:hypothetical protein